jgi:GNAT superfamily N-acetyltransferase
MEIIEERLEREYNLDIITTAPSVVYRFTLNDGSTIDVDNPTNYPDPGSIVEAMEPVADVHIYSPNDYVGAIMQLCEERRPMYAYYKGDQPVGYYSLALLEDGTCELNNLCVHPEYRHKGYAHEAVAAMKDWAFRNEFVYFIMVEESREGISAHRALHKLGFVPTNRVGEKGPYYEAERPFESATKSMLTVGVTFGLVAGGFVLNNLTAGILIGAGAGYVIAWILDAKDRRNREKLREKRK